MYRMFADVGDAWLQVPVRDLHQLGMVDRISSQSRLSGAEAYLHEEGDLEAFTAAAKNAGWQVTVDPRPLMLDREGAPSPVREMGAYDPYFAANPVRGGLRCRTQDGQAAIVLDVVRDNSSGGKLVAVIETEDGKNFKFPVQDAARYLIPPAPGHRQELTDEGPAPEGGFQMH